MVLLSNGGYRNQFRMKQENDLKSLLTDQQFEASDNRERLLAQAKACANGYALATEGIAVVSDFQNNECHIYAGKFGRTIMNLPEYMVDRNSAFEDIVFSHVRMGSLFKSKRSGFLWVLNFHSPSKQSIFFIKSPFIFRFHSLVFSCQAVR